MPTSVTVRRHLEKQDVHSVTHRFETDILHVLKAGSRDIPAAHIACSTILKDFRGLVMAVHAASTSVDTAVLNKLLHRNLAPATPADYQGVFADCAPGVLPPLGPAYGFETVVDQGLLDLKELYFASGDGHELLRVSGSDFQVLLVNAWFGNSFSRSKPTRPKDKPMADTEHATPVNQMRSRIERITELPPMPTMAQQIIQLNANPYAHADDLAKLVERDPSLSAQIVRYAQSPFYGYRGAVASVRQAISRVLGYDMVMNMALGIAAVRAFRTEARGPLGLNAFWRHATYHAALCQALSNKARSRVRPRPGTAYLTGLLHNMGYLLLGHYFPEDFSKLNAAVAKEPQTPVETHEKAILGVTHGEIGHWLMQSWDMPAEISVCMLEHHNADYLGAHEEYVYINLIADRLLRDFDVGATEAQTLPAGILEKLALTEAQAQEIYKLVLDSRDGLDAMAQQLVA